jgi:hypothetical protein
MHSQVLGESRKLLVFGREIRFAVNFQQYADLIAMVYIAIHPAFLGAAALFLGGDLQPLFAQQIAACFISPLASSRALRQWAMLEQVISLNSLIASNEFFILNYPFFLGLSFASAATLACVLLAGLPSVSAGWLSRQSPLSP